jgi:hypothetical protein
MTITAEIYEVSQGGELQNFGPYVFLTLPQVGDSVRIDDIYGCEDVRVRSVRHAPTKLGSQRVAPFIAIEVEPYPS